MRPGLSWGLKTLTSKLSTSLYPLSLFYSAPCSPPGDKIEVAECCRGGGEIREKSMICGFEWFLAKKCQEGRRLKPSRSGGNPD